MKLQRTRLLLLPVSLLLLCGVTGCGEKPKAAPQKGEDMGVSDPKSTAMDEAAQRAARESIAAKREQQECGKRLGLPVEITSSIGMKLALVPAGEFLMGTSKEEIDRLTRLYPDPRREWFESEYPPHRVRISKPFYLGVHEVTVGQFRRFVEATAYKAEPEKDGEGGYGWNKSTGEFEGPDPKYTWRDAGFKQTDDHPVVNVTWNDAKAFCEWLSKKENGTYRLPTEAEWEYACRAGTTTQYYCGDDPERLSQVGNVADATAKEELTNYPDSGYISSRDGHVFTAPVGRFQPNAFGLHNMHGNVSEWCQDWHSGDYYGNSPPTDPQGPSRASGRVFRGGRWLGDAWSCRAASRFGDGPQNRDGILGFRVAAVPSSRLSQETGNN